MGIGFVTIVSWFRDSAVTYFSNDDMGDARFEYFKKVVSVEPMDMVLAPFTNNLSHVGVALFTVRLDRRIRLVSRTRHSHAQRTSPPEKKTVPLYRFPRHKRKYGHSFSSHFHHLPALTRGASLSLGNPTGNRFGDGIRRRGRQLPQRSRSVCL